ncbi:MAG: beta-ketoacyl-[acyl-carrier-protein] synthase family protein, partial [Elusimicrobiota bacterium]|nr:beta-ketoacyl-[acyl-carrier-protein] synthase family protein [Elusimicrobiota bacterium]
SKNFENIEKLETNIIGEIDIKNFEKELNFDYSKYDKNYILSYISAKEAIEDSAINLDDINPYKIGLFFGTCNGNILKLEKIYKHFNDIEFEYSEKLFDIFKKHCDGIEAVYNLFKDKKILGPKFVFDNACCATNNAIGFAAEFIKSGKIDVAIVGGADTICETTLSGFNSFKSMSLTGCSPFSINIGLSLGEGAGFCILENLEIAKNRNAKIYAEILAYSCFADANHITSPDPNGEALTRSMNEALNLSALGKDDIKVICSHGTGTDSNDKSETIAIKNSFFENNYFNDIYVTSTKSFYGHSLGASGIIQNIIMIDCMHENIIPPILNFGQNREGCDLNYIKNETKSLKYDKFISNSIAFGGNNVSIIISKFDENEKLENEYNFRVNEGEEIVISNFEVTTPIIKSKKDFFKKIEKNILLNEILKQVQENNFDFDFDFDNDNQRIIKYNKKGFVKDFLAIEKLKKFAKVPIITRFALKSFYELLSDENLENYVSKNREKIGIILGTYKSGLIFLEDFYLDILKYGIEYGSALKFQDSTLNSTAGHISNIFQIKGYNTSFWGNFSPLNALFCAIEKLETKRQKMIFVVGADAISQYDKRMIREKSYRQRILCEGAGALVVETRENAEKRNAKNFYRIIGFETTSYPIENFDLAEESYLKCIDLTLEKNNLQKKNIDLHIFCNCEIYPLDMKLKKLFKNTINSQQYTGLLEATSPILDIGLGIYYLQNHKFENILFSAQSVTGNNFSFILTK